MSSINDTIRNMIEKHINNIHTALPARIEDYDHKKMRAKIVLLSKKEINGENVEIPPVIEVPVMHIKFGDIIIRPGYEKDDIVQVMFNEKALDKLLITGKPENPQFSRKFSYDDAVVVGGLLVESKGEYPDEESKNLYICNVEKDMKIILEQEGNIRIVDGENGTELKFNIDNGNVIFTLANKLLLGSSSANEGVPLGDTLKTWLDNHKHPGDSGGTTGTPESPSPDPSSKTFVE